MVSLSKAIMRIEDAEAELALCLARDRKNNLLMNETLIELTKIRIRLISALKEKTQ